MTEKDGFIAAIADRDSIIKLQAAEIERLTAENEANMQTCKGIIKGLTADLERKDALLRECLVAFDAVAGKGALCNAAIANIKTKLREQT